MLDKGIFESFSNGLLCCIDWLSWTFNINCEMLVLDIINFLGFDIDDFISMPKGANGYRCMLVMNGHNIRILFEGNSDMGVHIDVSGSAIAELVNAWERKKNYIRTSENSKDTVLLDLLKTLFPIASFTRLDLAIDDIGCNYYSCDDVVKLIENQQLVSKFRGYDNKVPRSIQGGRKLGHTIYLGSSKSEIKLRIYDKRLEQLQKHSEDFGKEWIRWELELKRERANQAVLLFLECKSLSKICIGVLTNYIRFITHDNNNKSRCSNESIWDRFINDLEHMSLYVPSTPKNMEDTKRWIDNCVGASISAVVEHEGGSLDFIIEHLPKWHAKREHNRELTDRLLRSMEDKYIEIK